MQCCALAEIAMPKVPKIIILQFKLHSDRYMGCAQPGIKWLWSKAPISR